MRRFAKPLSGVTCFEGSNPSLSASQARHLPNGYAFTFPNRGHGQLVDFEGMDISCPTGIADAFMAQPGSAPAADCIDDMPATMFAVDAFESGAPAGFGGVPVFIDSRAASRLRWPSEGP